MSQRDEIESAARAFLDAAIAALRRDHVVPPPTFHLYIRVGRDYYGDAIRNLDEYADLEHALEAAYPARFAAARQPAVAREFPQTYIFSLLEATVARSRGSPSVGGDTAAVTESIDELLGVIDADDQEVVCARVVSCLTTSDRQPLRVGEVSVLPEDDGPYALERAIGDEIPGALAAFNREPPVVYEPPHALLVSRARSGKASPFGAVEGLSRSLARFLLQLRLLTAGSVRSLYEVRGSATLVSGMAPNLVIFNESLFPGAVTRAVGLDDKQGEAIAAIGKLIDSVAVDREGMVTTSLDVALRNYQRSFRTAESFDYIVDLATSLESALAGGESDNEGLTLRLRNRAATLLATDEDPAQTIFADVGQLYGLRSKLVHGGQLKEVDLRRIIRKISRIPAQEEPMMFGIALGHLADRLRDLVRRALLARLCLATPAVALWPIGAKNTDQLLTDDVIRTRWRSGWRAHLAEIGAPTACDPASPASDLLTP